ncbi:MAG: glycoside hydrolase family 18 protein [Oscillospiraceae bacterium]
MKIIPKFLGLFNYKVEQNSFDGNKPISSAILKGKVCSYIDIDFDKPTTVNLITLFEKGENITDFEIYAETDGTLKKVYKQNRISDFRVCAIPEMLVTKIRIIVLGTRSGTFDEIKAFVYNLPKKERSFRKTAYLTTESYENVDVSLIKHYTNFNLIGGVKVDVKSGEINYSEVEIDGVKCSARVKLEGAMELVRKNNPTADIVVTLFSDGSFMDMMKNPNTIGSIKNFLDEFNLNGISFDWEYPKNGIEWRAFDKFIINLKAAIGEKTLTLALASWIRYNFSKKALDSIDVAEVMTYDNMQRDIDGHHSEFYIDGPNAIYHFVDKGFKLSQLNLGLPYYARPVDGTGYWKNYKDEVSQMDRFTNVVHGDYEDLDWKQKTITVKDRFYNGCQMVEDKTAFCIYSGVGGIMVWHIGTDVPDSHELCLSKTVTDTVNSRTE